MFAYILLVLTLFSAVYGTPKVKRDVASYRHVCQAISAAISSKSAVYYPGSTLYTKDVYHYSNSSTQQSACTVEPGSAKDVGVILRLLGSTRTPFGVKSGGHAMNPGFSSSKGVQIALYRFNEVDYDAKMQSVVIGAGLNFDDVYAALAPNNVSVAGGRVTGIGVGGFLLGGGYSWKTNQYGLGIDTIIAYELVLPDGKVVQVTKKSDAELFFGLKGGYNNFGIVTRFTVKALPQTSIWGGTIIFPESSVLEVTTAVIEFSGTNSDTKANIIPSYAYYKNQIIVSQMLYYDSSTQPAGFFDNFLTIPSARADVRSRSLTDFISNTVSNSSAGLRGAYHTVPLLEYTQNIMKVIQNETIASCPLSLQPDSPTKFPVLGQNFI
ncbi:hypothetical protein APHAL10511_005335 [Amanita phalloides]|nr:hypothetical protein APHAL10511_005335 [Amanita phalloides]